MTTTKTTAQRLKDLQRLDERLEEWLEWMLPGAKFRTSAGNTYKIESFDRWGNFECIGLGKACESNSFRCSTLALQTPLN